MEWIGYILAALVGISLGTMGAGGSILTIPILVYAFGIGAAQATSYSLVTVGITALAGAFSYYKKGEIRLGKVIGFVLASVVGMVLVRRFLLPLIPEKIADINHFILTKDALILYLFVILMLMASYVMISGKKYTGNSSPDMSKLIISGIGVGAISGLLGAGGGFIIIPSLVIWGRLQMKEAVGTSLLIIFCNAAVGMLSDVYGGVQYDYKFLGVFTLITLTGMVIGLQVEKFIDNTKLKPVFGWFVLIVGVTITLKEAFLNR